LAARRGADDLVAVISHDLSSAYQFLRAAEALVGAGRPDEALAWLSHGNEAFEHPHPRLDDYAADLHHQQGRHELAARIGWQRFAANPGLGTYRRLHTFAAANGDWPTRRDAALTLLRNQPTAPAPEGGTHGLSTWAQPRGHSTLVEVLTDEGDIDAAWEAAHHGGCTRAHWLDLARARASDHPADAIPVIKREILDTLASGNRKAYQSAARLAKELLSHAHRADQDTRIAAWIKELRTTNARRPALQDEFDRTGLPKRSGT
jgi:uncharacterized Zn finger protein